MEYPPFIVTNGIAIFNRRNQADKAFMDLKQLSFHKTRIAPTPSGYLHLGNVLSFALTAWLAEQTGASILLRIDDLDRQRMQRAYVEDIFDTLQFLNIPWHEGPHSYDDFERSWSQLHRLPLYDTLLQQLASTGKVYACNCSRSQLGRVSNDSGYSGECSQKNIPLTTEAVNWRLRTVADASVKVNTLNGPINTSLPATMKDLVIRKKDGYPAYQLSSVADDIHYGIDLIVRGADLWPSTLVQCYLAGELESNVFSQASFYHHSLLMNGGEEKLSKSAGSTSIQYLRKQGNTASDVCKMIARAVGIAGAPTTWQELAAAFWEEDQRINLLAQKNI